MHIYVFVIILTTMKFYSGINGDAYMDLIYIYLTDVYVNLYNI